MNNQYTTGIKGLMDNVFSVADTLDEKGVSAQIPFVDSEGGMRGAVRTDVVLYVFRIMDKDKRIDHECIDYLNECIGFNFTTLTAEVARKRAVEADFPQNCALLPYFILIDKQLGGHKLSSLYIRTLAFVALGYFQSQDCTTLEEAVRFCRYTSSNIELIENTLGEKLDFDLFDYFDSEQIDLIKCAVEVDKQINNREEDPLTVAVEEALVKTMEDKDNPSSECTIVGADEGRDRPDLAKDPGDGSDLPDEESIVLGAEGEGCSALDELDKLVGLQEVKQQVRAMLNVQKVRRRCKELGVNRPAIGMHMIFTGNPGTGKTTVARIVAEIYKEAGILSKGQLVEATRAELVGKFVGHTAVMVKEIFEKAKGGVLFIDEAYALSSDGDDFGEEAIETLLKLMEDNREDTVVIAAGYPKLMQDFLESNPGFRSRFPFVIQFPDYSGEELVKIFRNLCAENDIIPDQRVLRAVNAHFINGTSKRGGNYGNARAMRNFFEKMLQNQANRLVYNGTLDRDDICSFSVSDLPASRMEGNRPNPKTKSIAAQSASLNVSHPIIRFDEVER